MFRCFFPLALTLMSGFALGPASALAAEPPKTERPKVYDESANVEQQVADAVARAQRNHTRVLIQWGANWCGWCVKLHDLCAKDPEINKTLRYEYEVVHADVGKMDKWVELRKKLGVDFANAGIPYLTILDEKGAPLVQQATGPLEVDDHHDPAKVLGFLKQHAAPTIDATAVLDAALAQAKQANKLVFVHFGAPWCGWCHKLEDWLATREIADHVAQRAIEVKIDIDRMTHGPDVMKRFRSDDKGGIPWFAFIDAEGKTIATSDDSGQNIGYPAADSELLAFVAMLEKAKYTDESILALRASLSKAAQALKR